MSDEIEAQILETAGRLFFTQGYAQTGINQLIDESRVAKLNMAAEFADAGHHVRVRVREYKALQRQLLRALIDPRVDDATLDAMHVLLEGAIAAAAAHLDAWPIRAALRAAETLVGTGSRRARSSSKRPKARAPSNSGM